MRRTFTVSTCCRCQKEQEYKHGGKGSNQFVPWAAVEDAPEEWATLWQTVTPLDHFPLERTAQQVCVDCLTEAERETLTDLRREMADEIPF
jgi:hypothetical protein